FERQALADATQPPRTAAALKQVLETSEGSARQLVAALEAALAEGTPAPAEAAAPHDEAGEPLRWARALLAQCRAGHAEFIAFGSMLNPAADGPAPVAAAAPSADDPPLPSLGTLAAQGVGIAHELVARIEVLAQRVEALIDQEQDFLYDDRRNLLS